MSAKRMGMAIVVDDTGIPEGIFTDGDLRRLIERHGDIRGLMVGEGMTRSPRSIGPQALAAEAAALMDDGRLNQMLVLDDSGALIGALHMHDLLAAKVI
jgi:arabinose-5-phosphate isomerase